ncbi:MULTISPECIES: riboflavin synthase [Desulfococcus]|uniref:Riboflavin synthase n=1 Tax=Desulfococcus multivorans DSM 2059 TaxID=1121405 RepID=S7TZT7_DESML|nr:riboflavin synthase [Desulfococcus multivorans]AOY58322.1 RibE: riboflavin synthase, alpha chain [Desulfococcus multivorans]AQV00657.1 riboflavin synthase [Desulfococcus multivorans]EPR42602.1 riboflavin synthase, alpha subunit [Desulfococcus multivorans DSM 2059]MDX9818439.1 riboflavin synthase [Desulfococcus multivorans]SKA18028.1 riboflavin synthase alpha chain [Desulfococcus multivorans DSM 2059]
MFTGIIEGLGTIRGIQPTGEGCRLSVEADFRLSGTRLGDSIAVNGACLTAVALDGPRFTVDVSPETLDKTTLGRARIGDRVNLERALRLSDRLDGHLVSGHIDGIGTLTDRKHRSNAVIIAFRVPPALARYMISKGSVAVDGVSLTINACTNDVFEVSIIPHTAKLTTVGMKSVGDAVNIETDIIGKYVERFVAAGRNSARTEYDDGSVDMALLARHGFL